MIAKQLKLKRISDAVWMNMVIDLWNDVENRMGLNYATPWTDHEGNGEWGDWMGSVK